MSRALISLGSNLGDRQQSLIGALARLADCAEIHVAATSRWYATSPVGGPAGQGEFLNAAALVETSLSAVELLAELKKTEKDFGRQRHERWDARILDLDVLLFDDQIINTPDLVVPHPRMAFRRFVLEPAAEIAATMCHPTSGRTVEELLENIDRRPRYVALAGQLNEKKRKLAEFLVDQCDGILISDPIADENFSLDVAKNLFTRRAKLLRESTLDLQKTSISDFWIDELCAKVAENLSVEDAEHFADTFRKRRPEIATPALLIVLDDAKSIGDLQQGEALDTQIAQSNLPAILRLDTHDWPTAQQESVAAVLAM